MNTSEKKCEQCENPLLKGIHTCEKDKPCKCHCHECNDDCIYRKDGNCCQKEQPEECKHDGAHREVVVCDQCKEIIPEMKSSKSTPPQELRQEGEWEKHVAPSPTLEKKLMCILGECPVQSEDHLFQGFGEYCKFKGLTRVFEKFGELKILIKEIEQKARKEERKRCSEVGNELMPEIVRDGNRGHTYGQGYKDGYEAAILDFQRQILNKPTP